MAGMASAGPASASSARRSSRYLLHELMSSKTPAMPQLAAAPRAGVRRVFHTFFLTQTMAE
jgi:hypothetical protein